MNRITEQIRTIAERLLRENVVDRVVGFERGSLPLKVKPLFARTPEEAKRLVWNGLCVMNPAALLGRTPGRTAVVAPGCVSRNLVELLQEHQVNREDLYVIGVPCPGQVDEKTLQELAPGPIEQFEDQGEVVVVSGRDFKERIPRKEVLRRNCRICAHPNPVLFDELAGEPVAEPADRPEDPELAEWEALPPEERWARFQDLIRDCIRCNACRDACPLCYCSVCFVDEHRPQWCGKTGEEADVATFHLLRAFHCAGRCTDCGACEAACPQGIQMRILTRKLEKDVRELYGTEAGMDLDRLQPLCDFREEDPQEFIK